MLPSVGFVLVTYSQPSQIVSLCRRLNEMFGDPPIALHHDFGQCSLDGHVLPDNVHVVKDWNRTGWGVFPVVDANLKALKLLYEHADPDWTVSLSTNCYPIKTAQQIREYFEKSEADAYFEHRLIAYERERDRADPDTLSRADRWLMRSFERYIAVRASSYKVMALLGQRDRVVYLKHPFFTEKLTPFRNGFRCFAGEAWYTVNRKGAQALLRDTPFSAALRHHYRNRRIPEESYYHTILLNEPGMRVENFSLTYTDWSENTPHPKTLGYEDFPALLASDRLFARKWKDDQPLLRALDRAVEQHAQAEAASPESALARHPEAM